MFYRWQRQTLLLYCHLQPKASREEFAGLYGERLKIRLRAQPVDGKANAALIAFIAKQFSVPKSRVQLLSGDSQRQKTLAIDQPQRLPPELEILPAGSDH